MKDDKIYIVFYNPMIYESNPGVISIHRTRKGAEMVVEFHKAEKRKEFDEMYNGEEPDICFGSFEAWFVDEEIITG